MTRAGGLILVAWLTDAIDRIGNDGGGRLERGEESESCRLDRTTADLIKADLTVPVQDRLDECWSLFP